MDNETISGYQGMATIILAISGTSLVVPFARDAGSDIWIAIILGILFSIPVFFIYSKILSLYEEKNLFDILEIVFNKIIAKTIIVLFAGFSFLLGVSYLFVYGHYLTTVSLPETPIYFPLILKISLIIWIVKSGIEVIGRWSTLFLLLNSPLPSIVVLLLIPQMDFNNLTPLLYNGFKPVLMSSFTTSILAFSESVVLCLFLFSFQRKVQISKVFIWALLLVGFLSFGVSTTAMLVLGSDLYVHTLFPIHNVSTKIEISTLLERLEPIIVISTTTAGFLKTSLSIYVCSKCVSKLFNFNDYRFIVTPLSLIILSFSFFIFDNISDTWYFATKIYPFFAAIFTMLLPLLILVACLYNKSNSKNKISLKKGVS